jgi:hypothetical protein
MRCGCLGAGGQAIVVQAERHLELRLGERREAECNVVLKRFDRKAELFLARHEVDILHAACIGVRAWNNLGTSESVGMGEAE